MAASYSAEARLAATAPFNFSAAAGPLPAPVIAQVAEACRDWRGQGSVLSLPFTGEACAALMVESRALLREILAIPDSHDILFLQGGASAQFGLVPLNLLGDNSEAAYLASGHWSRRAIAEAEKHCTVHVISDPTAPLDPDRCAYLHLTSNETADGLQLHELPQASVPMVADMTSDFLTRRIDWLRVDLAYAAMQKSIGVAGLTILVLRRELLGRARPGVPPVFDYRAQAAAGSRVNTPPVFAIFVTHAMLAWIADQGGLGPLEAAVVRRSEHVYTVLDAHPGTFHVPAPRERRSRTSLCFGGPGPGGNEACIAAAAARGILGLAGHPQAGGLRAAIYAGTSEAAVDRLCDFLADFADRRPEPQNARHSRESGNPCLLNDGSPLSRGRR
jgi:phosphoserine aminotransferase